jgi:hypothetical protein
VAVLLAALGLGACGGSSPKTVSKAELISRADAICSDQNRQINAVPSPKGSVASITKDQMPAAASYFDTTLAIARAHLKQIKAVGRPDRDQALYQQALAQQDAALAAVDSARQAAHAGDPTAFQKALGEAGRSGVSSRDLAQRFGFKVCGTAGR